MYATLFGASSIRVSRRRHFFLPPCSLSLSLICSLPFHVTQTVCYPKRHNGGGRAILRANTRSGLCWAWRILLLKAQRCSHIDRGWGPALDTLTLTQCRLSEEIQCVPSPPPAGTDRKDYKSESSLLRLSEFGCAAPDAELNYFRRTDYKTSIS